MIDLSSGEDLAATRLRSTKTNAFSRRRAAIQRVDHFHEPFTLLGTHLGLLLPEDALAEMPHQRPLIDYLGRFQHG